MGNACLPSKGIYNVQLNIRHSISLYSPSFSHRRRGCRRPLYGRHAYGKQESSHKRVIAETHLALARGTACTCESPVSRLIYCLNSSPGKGAPGLLGREKLARLQQLQWSGAVGLHGQLTLLLRARTIARARQKYVKNASKTRYRDPLNGCRLCT